MKNKKHNIFKKSQLLGRLARTINLALTAKCLMYYSEIGLSALHLVESDTTIK